MRESEPETYSEEEQQWLRDLLASAPGVDQVKTVSRHPKGGYSVTMDVAKEKIDALVEFLAAHGLCGVI